MRGLLLRLLPGSSNHKRYSPILFVRTLVYDISVHDDDVRYMPYLCDVLKHANNLRILRIDTCNDSESILLSFFRRRGIIRTSLSAAEAAYDIGMGIYHASVWTLPFLAVVRSSSTLLAAELFRFRNLRAIVLDAVTSRDDLICLLDSTADSAFALRLEAFTCCLFMRDVPGALQAVAMALPKLRYLGIFVFSNHFNMRVQVPNTAEVSQRFYLPSQPLTYDLDDTFVSL